MINVAHSGTEIVFSFSLRARSMMCHCSNNHGGSPRWSPSNSPREYQVIDQHNAKTECDSEGRAPVTAEARRRVFAKARCETVETGIVKYDAEEAAEVAILSRDCMKHLGDWYYPEGGWGWVVMAVSMVTSVLSWGMVMGGGHTMVREVNSRLGLESTDMTGVMVTTGSLVSTQLWSPLTSQVVSNNSPRLCAFIAGLLMSLSLLFTSFATKLHQIIISYCFLFPLGVSISETSFTLVRGQYFKKRRLHLEVIMTSSYGMGVSVMSLVQQLCFQAGGWRLGLQMMSGLFTLTILTSLLLRPASVYHPQRHAILHMRQYMRQILGKSQRPQARSLRDTVARLVSNRSVRVVLVSGGLSSLCLLTPLLYGHTQWSLQSQAVIHNVSVAEEPPSPPVLAVVESSPMTRSDVRGTLLQLLLGLSFSVGSYSAGRLCLSRHSRQTVICVTITLVSSIMLTLAQTISTLLLKLSLSSLLAGALVSCSRVYLYKHARSHYASVLSLLSCVQAVPTLLSVLIYSGCQYGALWSGVANAVAGAIMALHVIASRHKKYSRSTRNDSLGACNGGINNNIKTVKFSQDIELDEVSQRFLSKFGVKHFEDVINSVHQYNEKQFVDHITSCNKVSNGVLLDEYQHNLDAALNSPSSVNKVETLNRDQMEWIETKMHLRRRSSL